MSNNLFPINPVLIVDDENHFLQSASFALKTSGMSNLITCNDSREVEKILSQKTVSIVLLDIMMPHKSGREILDFFKKTNPHIPVIMLTAVNEVETAVDCMKAGAFDYMIKPIEKIRLVTTVRQALEMIDIRQENRLLQESLLAATLKKPDLFGSIVTNSDSMRSLFKYIEAVAVTSLPITITGETGTGKELIAKAIHDASGRSGPYLAVNVAGLDDTLFSDTLFGHERGAFTGADSKRTGLVSKASGGTLFLDEIGDLRKESQVKLLRLLEERMYYPVGSDNAQMADARIIVATNCDLPEKMKNGEFRVDLYYRLASHQIKIPPLRSRKSDIPGLIEYFLKKAATEMNRKVPSFPHELFDLLNTYHFPGNIRELRGMVYDALSRHQSGILSLESFKEHLGCTDFQQKQPVSTPVLAGKVAFGEQLPTLKEIEEQLVEEALKRSSGNQSVAANLLGITRSALNKRVNNKDSDDL